MNSTVTSEIRVATLLLGLLALFPAVACAQSPGPAGPIEELKVLDGTTAFGEPVPIQRPFIEEAPFDLVFLDKFNKYAVLKIEPLRNPPEKPYSPDKLIVFDFKEESEDTYQVPLGNVVDYKTYNQILMAESDLFLADNNYPAALRNLLYVYDNGGKRDPEIVEALNKTLFVDATNNFRQERYELALSIYEDIYRKNPDFQPPGLDKKIGEVIMLCYEGITRRHFTNNDFIKARSLLESVKNRYPKESADLIVSWEQRFVQKSDELVKQAREFAANNQGREAHMVARRANALFPGRQSNKDLYDEIVKQFPMVFVGVQQPSLDSNEDGLFNWSARRFKRLTQRSLFEFIGTSDEGGVYQFVGGLVRQVDEIGLKFEIELTPRAPAEYGRPELSAYKVAALLNAYGSKSNPNYSIPWAKVIEKVAIENENLVTFTLKFPFVRPESLIQVPLNPPSEDGVAMSDGPYVKTGEDEEFSTYEPNPIYDDQRVEGRQYPKIMEQTFASTSDAIDALINGDIDIVDRVPISDIPKLKSIPEIEVRSYLVPTVHMLIPNQRNEFMKNSNFRLGLLRGIDRGLLLNEIICNGQEVSGCELVSGPWPIGNESSDQLAYGYNMDVRASQHNLKLAMVLVEVAANVINEMEKKKNEKAPKIEKPIITLAFPDNYVASLACQQIRQNWTEMGLKVNLRRLKKGEAVPDDDDWDLLYTTAAIEEPLSDAGKLFGPDGIIPKTTAPIEQSMRALSQSPSWPNACETLRRMHRQSVNDLMVIPLWQLTEFVAFRNNVRGIGRDMIHLYQGVDRWSISSTYKRPGE